MKLSILAAALLLPPGLAAQNPVPAGTRVYSNPELHLRFSYPAELQPQTVTSPPRAAKDSMFGSDPDAGSKPVASTACSHVLLSVGTPASPAANSASASPAVAGSILLMDTPPECIPQKAQRNRKTMIAVLARMTADGSTTLGMMPLWEPSGYQIQGHPAYLAAVHGQPVAATEIQPNGDDQSLAVVAIAANGHILSWRIQSSDSALFNRLLTSMVDFGGGPPQPLVLPQAEVPEE